MVCYMKLSYKTFWQFILPLVFLLPVMVFAQIPEYFPSANAQVDEEFLTYENPIKQVSIQYPSDWEPRPAGFGTVIGFFSPLEGDSDQFSENLNIGVQPLLRPMTLDEIIDDTVSTLEKQTTDFKLITVEQTILANQTARKMVYQLTSEELHLMGEIFVTIKDHKQYYLTFGAESENFARYLPIVEKMVESFQIQELQPTTENGANYQIPYWLRNNAGWWGEGTITDDDFFNGIGYLIKQDIMIIPEPEQEALDFISKGSLNWAKGNTLRWSLGTITDENFVVLVQYFIENEFVKGFKS